MTKEIRWTVPADQTGRRLDAILAEAFPDRSRSNHRGLILNGNIIVDGVQVKPSMKALGGEKLCIVLPDEKLVDTIAQTPLNFPILFEDEHLIVINKPSNLVAHPGAGHEEVSVVSALLSHCQLCPIGAPLRPGIIHRLDKETSGVMVLAKTEIAHKRLVKAFSEHLVDKTYLGIAQGEFANNRGVIKVAIERDRQHRKRMMATRADRGKMAISHFQVKERFRAATMVEVIIETGRTHQIRVHLSYIGNPLLGDKTYQGKKWPGHPHHFLHSHRLKMLHPISEKIMIWIAPLPDDFQAALAELRSRSNAE